MTIKLGLVGFGEWGQNYFRTIRNLRNVELAAICKRDPSTVPAPVRKVVPVTTSLEQVLRKGAKGVIVATPPSSHREIACFYLERGIPVMLEKPVAETIEDAEAVFEASARSGAPVLVNHVHLFSPAFNALKRSVSPWSPIHVRSEAGNQGPYRSYSALLDWGPHDVAMAMAVFGRSPDAAEIRSVSSDLGDVYNIRLQFGDSLADLTVGNGMASKRRVFEASCGDRIATYDGEAKSPLTVDGLEVSVPGTRPLEEATFMFSRCVDIRDMDWRFSPGLALDVMRILSVPVT